MREFPFVRRAVLVLALLAVALVSGTAPDSIHAQPMGPEMRRGMMRGGMMGRLAGSMPRHRVAMHYGVPPPYATKRNPVRWSATLRDSAVALYRENCASCHGPQGRGDGEAGRDLVPPPADLQLLARTRFGRWDAFLFWAIAAGGEPFGTDMPAFADSLEEQQIWTLVSWIERGLPGL